MPDSKYLTFALQYAVILIVLSGASIRSAQAQWWPFGNDTIDYTIRIDGVDADTYAWLKRLKLIEKTQQHPPENIEELQQEEIALEQQLNLALKARGYYDAQIDGKIDTQSQPPLLHYTIHTGVRAQLSAVKLDWQGGALSPIPPLPTLPKEGDPIDAEIINASALKLHKAIGKNACLLSLNVRPLLQLNVKNHTATLVYRISYGSRANFGAVRITGTKRTKKPAITRMLTFKQGECYTQEKVIASQSALFGSQLFSSVEIIPSKTVNAKGEAPIHIKVEERASRTIRTGLNYATDKGLGVSTGWEDRNFSGSAEKVNVDAILAEQQQSLSLTERIPAFLRKDQSLNVTGGIKHENTDAYVADAFNVNAGLERKISRHLNVGTGVGYDLKRTDDIRRGAQNYSLLSLPSFAEYDTRDSATDAYKGIFSRANVTPYQDMLDPSLQFLKSTLTAQTYFSHDGFWKPTLALRGSVGSIVGSSYRDLPADLRYYAGGGGSVRGYAYQSLSPRLGGQSIGGGSLLELSSEARFKFSETIGGVVFLDAGNAYTSALPDPSELYVGAGIGARYYSAIGPIRLDVGVPLDRSDVNTAAYQVYVSIGQAF